MEKNILCAKTQKITIFQNQGGANAPPAPPNDVPGSCIHTYSACTAVHFLFHFSGCPQGLSLPYFLSVFILPKVIIL